MCETELFDILAAELWKIWSVQGK